MPGGGALRSAGPDQVVLAVALDQVRVDRRGEARIVDLDADEFALALAGAGPAGTDLDLVDESPVVGSTVAALVDFVEGDLGLEAEGLNGAVETGVGFGEGADSCHGDSPLVYLDRAHRGLDGSDQAVRETAAPAGRNAVADGSDAVIWSAASARNGKARGKNCGKRSACRCGHQVTGRLASMMRGKMGAVNQRRWQRRYRNHIPIKCPVKPHGQQFFALLKAKP